MDKLLLIIATLISILVGIANPLMMIYFGDITKAFVDYTVNYDRENVTSEEIDDAKEKFYKSMTDFIIATTVLGVISVILAYVSTVIFHYTAQKQVSFVRKNLQNQITKN